MGEEPTATAGQTPPGAKPNRDDAIAPPAWAGAVSLSPGQSSGLVARGVSQEPSQRNGRPATLCAADRTRLTGRLTSSLPLSTAVIHRPARSPMVAFGLKRRSAPNRIIRKWKQPFALLHGGPSSGAASGSFSPVTTPVSPQVPCGDAKSFLPADPASRQPRFSIPNALRCRGFERSWPRLGRAWDETRSFKNLSMLTGL